jgi:predicted nucleic acid-binding protein
MAHTARARGQAPRRLILDSGAVIALARGDQRARAFLARALEVGALVEIPVVVLAETLRGGPRDAPLHRVLKAVGPVPEAREAHGRRAGQLLGAARSASTIDALVVAHAVEAGGAHVLTGDPDDLERLAASHPEVWIQPL